MREWRDIHAQLQTVVAEHGWRINASEPTYEQLHQSILAGLLGNIGIKSDEDDSYLGARGIRFWRHPGARAVEEAGALDRRRRAGRDDASLRARHRRNRSALGCRALAGHLLKKQLLEPHWEKKAAQVVALERATLYGIVIYANRRVDFGNVDPAAAREIFIREALVAGEWETKLPFLAAQPQADRADRGARAQVAPPGRARRRRADLRLLRPAGSGRRHQRRALRALVPRRGPAPAAPADAHARGADAPRGGRHHDGIVPEDDPPRRRRLRGALPARAWQRTRRRHRDGADLCAEPGERGTLRMARSGDAQGQGDRARQDVAATATVAPRAAARVRRRVHRRRPLRRGEPARCARRTRGGAERPAAPACRLQARAARAASAHEPARRRRARPADRRIAQPRRAEGEPRRAGPLGLPGTGGAASAGRGRGRRVGRAARCRAGDGGASLAGRAAPRRRAAASRLHVMDLRRASRADGAEARRPGADRLSGVDRQGHARRDRSLRRARGRARQAPCRPAPAGRAADPRSAEGAREERPRPAEDGDRFTCRSAARRSCASRSSKSRSSAPFLPNRCRAMQRRSRDGSRKGAAG